jgi:hypothetical protein
VSEIPFFRFSAIFALMGLAVGGWLPDMWTSQCYGAASGIALYGACLDLGKYLKARIAGSQPLVNRRPKEEEK